jgi:hypothetical protein
MIGAPRPLPLDRRPSDWFFIVCFSCFAFSSFFSDAWAGLGVRFAPDSASFWARANYWYAQGTDPYLLANPIHLRVQTLISGFVFGPFYLLLVYAFATGKNWIRMPAIIYVSAMVYGMCIFLGSELFGDLPPTNFAKFAAFNVPYLIVPLLLGYRMRRARPFSP